MEKKMTEIPTYTITSITDYLNTIISLKDTHKKLWFRGHESTEYKLMPTIYRKPYSWQDEKPLLNQFKARAARFTSSVPKDDVEWLFIMQHHSTPTRLLDWSESALVALSFATQYKKEKHDDVDSVVWCVNPIKLNSYTRFPSYEYEKIPNICADKELQTLMDSPRQDYPLAVIGTQNTDRIIAQKGVFILFPEKDSFELESKKGAHDFLVKIIIPKDCVKDIKKDLYYIGITESSLFPELDSISKELKHDYEGEI